MTIDLSRTLKEASRVAVVGVGSDLRGDDAAGVEAVRKLKRRLTSSNVLLVEAGVAPESFTAQIKKFKPSHVLIIDVADFEAKPGSVVLAESSAIIGQSISTHRLPLSLLADYLREQTGAKILLLGIQPSSVVIGAQMSKPVRNAIDELAESLFKCLASVGAT